MRRVAFTAYGVPVPKGSTKAFPYQDALGGLHARTTSDNPQLDRWEATVRLDCLRAIGRDRRLFEGPVKLTAVFYFPRPKSVKPRLRPFPTVPPDCSKLVRAAEDPLTGILWKDDSQVVRIDAAKLYTNDQPRAEISVEDYLGE